MRDMSVFSRIENTGAEPDRFNLTEFISLVLLWYDQVC